MSSLDLLVENAYGEGLPGANVVLTGAFNANGTTDSSGHFFIHWGCSPFGEAVIKVTVSKPGYVTQSMGVSRPNCLAFAGNIPATMTLLESASSVNGVCPNGFVSDGNGNCIQNPSPSVINIFQEILASWEFWASVGLGVITITAIELEKYKGNRTVNKIKNAKNKTTGLVKKLLI